MVSSLWLGSLQLVRLITKAFRFFEFFTFVHARNIHEQSSTPVSYRCNKQFNEMFHTFKFKKSGLQGGVCCKSCHGSLSCSTIWLHKKNSKVWGQQNSQLTQVCVSCATMHTDVILTMNWTRGKLMTLTVFYFSCITIILNAEKSGCLNIDRNVADIQHVIFLRYWTGITWFMGFF